MGTNKRWCVGLLSLLGGLFLTTSAAADWEIYVAGDLGMSNARNNTVGQQSVTIPTPRLGGEDDDWSPYLGGGFGIEIPMDELVPREWLVDVRLPNWPVRFGFDAGGFREYELLTFAGPQLFFGRLDTTTFFFNSALEIPLTSIYRPVQYTFGLGRQPRIRQILEPASFYTEVGVGFGATDFRGTSGAISASDDFIEFAWNAGAGFSYAVNDVVDISAGYRFICLAGDSCMVHSEGFELTPTGGAASPNDFLDVDAEIHEFRLQVRIEVWSFLSPWR